VLQGVTSTYFNWGGPRSPVLALRAGGQRVFGDFPYFDAAFLGGSRSLRTAHRQRYAGDASLFGNAELRVPVTKFGFILPLDIGVFGFGDVGRVWLDRRSPGGWHSGVGAGLWVGVLNPGTSLTVALTNSAERRVLLGIGTSY
jgi:hemolysin activation/secretion protein